MWILITGALEYEWTTQFIFHFIASINFQIAFCTHIFTNGSISITKKKSPRERERQKGAQEKKKKSLRLSLMIT